MTRREDRDLELRLRELRAPDEAEAEERSLGVVRAAYADHEPLRPSRSTRRIALGVGCGAVALAIGLSPAGARVGDLVSDVFESEPAGQPNAKPQLRSLPADGQLLVQSPQGPWVVQADGSKRLLGDYSAAAWSPHGRYVAVANGHELAAVDAEGTVAWTHPAGARVTRPVWSFCCDGPPPDQRVAYFSGNDLRVIDANGTDDRLIARDVVLQAPGWRNDEHVLTYVTPPAHVVSVDVDTGKRVQTRHSDLNEITEPRSGLDANLARSPANGDLAIIREVGQRSRLMLATRHGSRRTLFEAPGELTGPTYSPDGAWILVGWPDADQWLFIPVDREKKGVYFGRISEQFAPGATSPARFPEVLGWAPVPPG